MSRPGGKPFARFRKGAFDEAWSGASQTFFVLEPDFTAVRKSKNPSHRRGR